MFLALLLGTLGILQVIVNGYIDRFLYIDLKNHLVSKFLRHIHVFFFLFKFFQHQFFIVIFRVCIIMGVMEIQLLTPCDIAKVPPTEAALQPPSVLHKNTKGWKKQTNGSKGK